MLTLCFARIFSIGLFAMQVIGQSLVPLDNMFGIQGRLNALNVDHWLASGAHQTAPLYLSHPRQDYAGVAQGHSE